MTDEEFERFHAETAGPLRAYLVSVGGVESLADDLVQSAYLRLLDAAKVPEDLRARRVYLFRIARNLLADEFRRRRRKRQEARAPEAGGFGSPGLDCESRIEVQRALGKLSERDRELLWLVYVLDLSHREVAEVTGVAAGSVRVLLHRARNRFSDTLEEHKIGPDDLR